MNEIEQTPSGRREHGMRKIGSLSLCCFLALLATEQIGAQKAVDGASNSGSLRVFLLNVEQLEANRQRIRGGDRSLDQALVRLKGEARNALAAGPFSVVSKSSTPPSGDKHDYMSRAPYFWPNPGTLNHLPYVRRDGERNPEINKFPDHQTMDRMVSAVETLALAYYFDGDEAYADKAARLLRAWFVDPATRMNPNLEYAQAVPGINTGRGIGLIETRGLTRVVDTIGLLAGSKAWTESDQRNLEQWFGKFLEWMMESKNGLDESAARNNHGTYYDLQVASFALFVGRKDVAIQVLERAKRKRIATQIEPDGRQPLELARTKAWSYSVGNLDGLMLLALLGERVGVDLWSYRGADGRSIRQALNYLVPFALGERKWPYKQLGQWPPQMLFPLMRRAATKFQDEQYRQALAKLPGVDLADRSCLLAPANLQFP